MLTWRPAALVATGVLLVAVFQQPAWALLPLVIAAVAVCADLLLAGAVTEVRLSRDGDRQVRLGGTATVRLTVTNDGLRTVRLDVRDAWVPSAGAPARTTRLRLEPGAAAEIVSTLTPTRRGDRPAVRVSLRSYGPMMHAYRQATVKRSLHATPPWTLRVLPRFDSRRFLDEKIARLRVFDGAVVTRGRGQGTEFDSLREYVRGDDVRSLDWRASARRRDLVVRTWRPERDRHVLCVVDTGRTSAVRIGTTATGPAAEGLDEPRLDTAIDAALLLGEVANRAGDAVSLIAADTTIRASVTAGANRVLLPKLVNALAPLQPSLAETDFGMIVSEVLRRERKRALVVLFTALEPGALGEGLLPVLAQLTARHRVIIAAAQDPAMSELAGYRRGADAVYVAAAAHRTLVDRRRIVAALTRHDVTVVDAPPLLYASAVVDRYLEMKATGRL
jgi:uncharacterized protein (DUF58 family)